MLVGSIPGRSKITREMQGIVGQASDFVGVVSKIDWTLLHEIWWREIEKIKGDWRAADEKEGERWRNSTAVRS